MARAQEKEPDPNLLALGNRIRQLRAARRLTQEGLAHDSGLHRTVIGAIERGERDFGVSNLWPLAEALNVPVADLFQPSRRG